ncbi:bifunctional phosphopantothenoylcysteine decarboxylase/phosphopantothenate--cysteine ligase CoaBC [Pseudidiomarina sp. 1ASP75-14]|uniref:bifunctional phosphopantothenoylcysteine decarboxylase/phosphopantothenate--cysteine ligase CoaBC n=1 Tax=Pseudidiomarina terrestris TaxID=2820060 RepID=UPI00264BBA05|nr:bifunctional phosphopantothenoylcysteine decarboxylase/phosphopantothenate--cysteine ligase CoaBC [Pseudidiomarina sp. 1ASP75-14]MDN7137119.1 bifunctional phosphopantothenoylcysteine decarboxylase/phosphopantothenate--cysteine ligase CoaBC [Pseudidiomarina sp. 1ASP75-14]
MTETPIKSLSGRHVLVAVSGGIAAYKSPDLVRRLRDVGAIVRVVMTKGAHAFITPLTLQAVSGHSVHDDLLDPAAEAAMGHIELAKWADVILIAPASANTLARLAHGFADDLLSTLCLATTAPVMLAPAMNQQMWSASSVQRNMRELEDLGFHIIEPASGSQACGDVGAGRMPEPIALRDAVVELLAPGKVAFAGKHIVITAGPTREAIDPVRYLSNHSSGKMGYALATQALRAGAQVTLVTGPTQLTPPKGAKLVAVESAEEMLAAVEEAVSADDIFIACAAVADYRLARVAEQKIKKQDGATQLELVRTPDILSTIAHRAKPPVCVGFAAETQDVARYAADKLKRKKLTLIAANDVSDKSIGFNSDDNAMTLFWHDADGELQRRDLGRAPKAQIADAILTQLHELQTSR